MSLIDTIDLSSFVGDENVQIVTSGDIIENLKVYNWSRWYKREIVNKV